ncbi:MAG: nuclear transport factor 2 family protein [Acidimicrobiia bacterium]|nr:nuclear transport factor 2 family protein [Acidimicrobiia bacterium]MDH3397926.1 nuclear transport factor 2 family protein [Acidimicrobiia bacterium]
MSEQVTRMVVEDLYKAYFAGDPEGMLATMSDEVEVRFLGRGAFRGIDASRQFLTSNTANLIDLDFRIRRFIVDGEFAAAVWDESATTIHGDPYQNQGVDVFRVEGGEITVLHENNNVLVHRDAFGGTEQPS